jgi:restriction system protein
MRRWPRRRPRDARALGVFLVALLVFAAGPVGLGIAAGVALGLAWWRQRQRQREQAALGGLSWAAVAALPGLTFEHWLAARLRARGWQVTVTPASGDFGADLVGTDPQGRRCVIQAKRYRGPVGIAAVQEVFAARAYYGAALAILATTGTLTPAAQALAARTGVIVWAGPQLRAVCGA